jgi:hypothetical protein
MAVQALENALLKTWSSQAERDILQYSVWAQVSNRTDALKALPASNLQQMPQNVLHFVKDRYEDGSYSTTIPLSESLREEGFGGLQKAEGNEETQRTATATVYWNLRRKPVNASNMGVEQQSMRYFQKNNKNKFDEIRDWFAEDTDRSCQQAIVDGADQWLTDSKYWKDYTSVTTAPKKKVLNPNIFYPGMTARITRNFATYNYTTDLEAVKAALASLAPADGLTLANLDSAAKAATGLLKPLGWSAGGQTVDYIMLVSREQADQLLRDAAWVDLMKGADVKP